MKKRIMAHFTDTHLGQRLVGGDGMSGDRMRYAHEPEEHRERLRLVLNDISRKGIVDVVFGGDIGTPESVRGFFEILEGYDFTPSIVLGNHDAYRDVAQYCGVRAGAVEGKLCSSHDDGHLKRIFLDSSDNTIGATQLAWLAHELDGTSRIALFVHHPILGIDTPVERYGAVLRDQREIKTLLTSADCEVSVFCGHYHMIDEAREANIRQFVTPAVSYQIVKQSDRLRVDSHTFGYSILEIDGAEIKTETVLLTEAP